MTEPPPLLGSPSNNIKNSIAVSTYTQNRLTRHVLLYFPSIRSSTLIIFSPIPGQILTTDLAFP